MKKFLFIALMLSYSISSYSQMMVRSEIREYTNTLNSQFIFDEDEDEDELTDVSQDLFFSIGPNGLPQYGQSVSWNLQRESTGTARFFHVRKGIWDRSAISTDEETIYYANNLLNLPLSDTPDINMEDNWFKLGKSWNFSNDNYAIAILSFTNKGQQAIQSGTIKFSHPAYGFITTPETYIYNDWVIPVSVGPDNGRIVHEFIFENLEPKEIRHVYIKVDMNKQSTFSRGSIDFRGEMTGFQSDAIASEGIFPPHDPNALTLLTALESITTLGNCDSYHAHPDLQEACENGQPLWIRCPNEGDLKCPKEYSLNYPYCNEDSEVLTYRVTCLNDGFGVAQNVDITTTFDLPETPFQEGIFSFTGSHDVLGSFDYPNAIFNFKDIELPGLSSWSHVYTYDECSADVVFTVQTKCNLDVEIDAQAVITFYDTAGSSVGDVATNNILIVPEQGVYTNYEPSCVSCGHNGFDLDNRSAKQDLHMQQTPSELSLSFERESKDDHVSIKVFNSSGQILKAQRIQPNGFVEVNEQIDISNFHSGIYFVSIQSGKNNYVEKFVHQ